LPSPHTPNPDLPSHTPDPDMPDMPNPDL